MDNINHILSKELGISLKQVTSVIEMLDEGNTVPFIARYRKERTGGLTDEVLRKFNERLTYLRNLESRKEDVLRIIEEQEKLTPELKLKIEKATTLTEVEDIYRPFKAKKRTRATMAVEKGLKPLAELILSGEFNGDIVEEANKYINEEKGVKNEEEALQGAMDIISEIISDNADYRKWIRNFVQKDGIIQVKGSSEEQTPYEMYYDYKEPVRTIPSHRILAINRGEKEKILSVKVTCNDDKIIDYLNKKVLKGNKITDKYLEESIKDSFKRLIYPSIEREIRSELISKGEEGAIDIFKANLKALLMQAPIKGKVVMGFDPGFRTGCKVAILDETGKFVENTTVYPTAPQNRIDETISTLKKLIKKHGVQVISLGNGTASRESEEVIAKMLKEIKDETGKELFYVIVSEAGASVYSASELANKEYPDLDVTVRGAISIGRRLQDPLAELVKIDPKAIGVGQYQHDVTQKKLDESLAGIVEDCVNNVGVDLNIATPSLLSYISGINASIAKNIVDYREENGKFKSRKELLKVKRLGQKAYEQCAGFLRVMESKEALDNTSVHPESYGVAKELIKTLGYTEEDLKNGKLVDIDERVKAKGISNLAKELEVGEPTLNDIIKEIKKPGRDPREELPKPIFKSGVIEMKDLKPGMILMGTVRNVSDFGAFVDIGVHQDGLVHKSQMADRFVKHPLDIVKVGDVVEVRILDVDLKRKRISLSMKKEG
ncbi:MAG: RNA-binding transcriptional accessory protein Tex [Clostridium perfringens]|uniref:RNA-binding transcriptional accessory protein Tex n=1 Tax=Clostridium perfringens TaxID=1502 RepID=A0AAW4IY21_CLOPF|nr:RNA-binding transcriptional accessory protein Tex [Clostridium perfringens]EHP47999.1 competence protein ComEA helix-hairpin-helix repeat region [Clostridium perfringens WAL-14572]ELC8418859.1 RNA-binding transcriptional accessory protein Tex [Clostridium perfringens]MBO3355653.1 RNA-binding transcriptional accessory protein Tex [Clostridium perfringens]MBO3358924.1 RNA-binding transcriptional accessory protein Tex [Clostridium perfringens]MDU1256417.1 RNA-binding transcriptional accessory 